MSRSLFKAPMPQPSISLTHCNKLLAKRMHLVPGFYCFAVTGSAIFIIFPVMLISFNILPVIDDCEQLQYLNRSSFYLLFCTIHIFFWSRLATKTTILPTHLVLFPLSDISKFRMLIRISLSDYRIILHFIFFADLRIAYWSRKHYSWYFSTCNLCYFFFFN